MKLSALAAVLGVLVACSQAPDPDAINKPRVEQIQSAAFMSNQVEFKAVDDGSTTMKSLFKEVALDRDRRAAKLGISEDIDTWQTPDGHAISDFYLTGPTQDSLRTYVGDRIPQDRELAFERITPERWRTVLVSADAALDETDVATVNVSVDEGTHRPLVTMAFTPDGAQKFSDVTASIKGHKLAVLIDGTVASAPVITGRIEGGRAQVTFSGDAEAASFVHALSL
jgi:preprotein translocase subunit SecD